MKMLELKLEQIRAGHDTQARVKLDQSAVDEYAELMRGSVDLPNILVFSDGETYWLADGFHRIEAARVAGRETITAFVTEGDKRNAILHACGSNAKHGVRRTNADKRRAVELLLSDELWSSWSDREIAKIAKVSHPLVARVRFDLTGNITSEDRTYVNKHGTESTMKTDNIGKSQPEYRSVWQLEQDVRNFHRNMPFDEEVSVVVKYDTLVEMRDQGADHLFWSELMDYLQESYRKRDLQQALNNVIDQLRARAEQERLNPPELPPNTKAEELPDGRWIAISDIRYLATDAWPTREEAIQAWHDELTNRDYKLHWSNVFTLREIPTQLFSFIEGLKQATEEALTLALMNLPEENNEERFKLLTDRLIELTSEPEPTLDEAVDAIPDKLERIPTLVLDSAQLDARQRRLVELRGRYYSVLQTMHEFSELTGKHTDTLPVQRGLQQMIADIEANLSPKDDADQRAEADAFVDTAKQALTMAKAAQVEIDEILAPA